MWFGVKLPVALVFLLSSYYGEPAAQFPHTPPCWGRERGGNQKNRIQDQGRRDDRILPTLKIAGKALIKDLHLLTAICDPSGPPDLLPLVLYPIFLIAPSLPCKEEKNTRAWERVPV